MHDPLPEIPLLVKDKGTSRRTASRLELLKPTDSQGLVFPGPLIDAAGPQLQVVPPSTSGEFADERKISECEGIWKPKIIAQRGSCTCEDARHTPLMGDPRLLQSLREFIKRS